MLDFKKISDIKLPKPNELQKITKEHDIYNETPQESQSDHKNNEALKLVQDKAREDTNTLKIENANLEKLAKHRISYSWWIFAFVFTFLILVLSILLLSGFKIIVLSDNVLNTLLATNMVQIVGVLYIVAKWLYPNK